MSQNTWAEKGTLTVIQDTTRARIAPIPRQGRREGAADAMSSAIPSLHGAPSAYQQAQETRELVAQIGGENMTNANGIADIADHDTDQSHENVVERDQNGLEERQTRSASVPPPIVSPEEGSSLRGARNGDLEIRQAPNPQEWYLYALAAVVVLGFFGLTVTMILVEIPPHSENIAYMLLGGLVTGFSMVLSYFFGSSAGSAQKTAQLAELVKQYAPKS